MLQTGYSFITHGDGIIRPVENGRPPVVAENVEGLRPITVARGIDLEPIAGRHSGPIDFRAVLQRGRFVWALTVEKFQKISNLPDLHGCQ